MAKKLQNGAFDNLNESNPNEPVADMEPNRAKGDKAEGDDRTYQVNATFFGDHPMGRVVTVGELKEIYPGFSERILQQHITNGHLKDTDQPVTEEPLPPGPAVQAATQRKLEEEAKAEEAAKQNQGT